MRSRRAHHEIESDEAAIRSDELSAGEVKQFPGIFRTTMDPRVYKMAMTCWICFLGVFWTTFLISANALFMLVIGTVYAVVFFGVPYLMTRIASLASASARPLSSFLGGRFPISMVHCVAARRCCRLSSCHSA